MIEDLTSDLEPLPEHDWLLSLAGTWDLECQYFYGDPGDPVEITGINRARTLGKFWLLEDFTFDLPAGPVRAHSATTFDPRRRIMVSTWIDSALPFPYHFEGALSPDRRTVTLESTNYDPATRSVNRFRSTIRFPADSWDERTLDFTASTPGGEVIPILHYYYQKRIKAK
ncbi:hypothetical protein BH23VER1_BH23VER1_27240 [soil metagenome]